MTDPTHVPLVTIVIPARNEGQEIPKALDHVAAQTYPLDCIEVVVVDGASQDNTVEVTRVALGEVPFRRAEVISNPKATTPSNLNRGLEWAAGDILVRVDSRSFIPPDYVERLVAVLRDPAVAVAGGSQVAVARSDSLKDRAIARALNNRYAMGGSSYRREGASSGPVDTVYLGSFRSEELRKAGGWNEAFPTNQDFELNRRMSEIGQVWFEAGLPVGYVGRARLRELWAQYHRFGRWKVRYWRRTNDRPQRRQWVLVAGPAAAGLVATAVGVARPELVPMAAILAVPAFLAVDAVGGDRGPEGVGGRFVSGLANVLIGAGWWTGIAREYVSHETWPS